MLRPSDIEQLKGKESRYAVVIAVAKRARDISADAEENGVILTEKPVSLAINDLKSGEFKFMVDHSIRQEDEKE